MGLWLTSSFRAPFTFCVSSVALTSNPDSESAKWSAAFSWGRFNESVSAVIVRIKTWVAGKTRVNKIKFVRSKNFVDVVFNL
jgi:hypothetical protein